MVILAHRGYWKKEDEKNRESALLRALNQGFGFESDVRDYHGDLVISHDIAGEGARKAEEVFRLISDFNNQYCFAVNIKADGLAQMLHDYISKYAVTNYFTFDMSVPQMKEYLEKGLKVYTRQSEAETVPVFYEQAEGVWMDGFQGTEWITKERIEEHLGRGKKACIVSPELHGRRDYLCFWERLRSFAFDTDDVMLCSDYPQEAYRYFKEVNQIDSGSFV